MKKLIENIYENKWDSKDLEELFLETINRDYSPKELYDTIVYIKNKQKIVLDLSESIDVCWTWWSGLDRLNTSTLTAIKLARSWVKVAKHWNKASSWKFGSFDLLESLNYDIPETEESIKQFYDKNNLVFLYANLLYPFLKDLAKLRKDYQKPTIFNILWPLLSPANSKIHLTWCWFEDKMQLMIETFKLLWKEKVLVLRWNDWLDEVTLSDSTKVFELNNWKISEYEINPEDFWFEKVNLDRILVSDTKKKIEISKKIITWEEDSSYNDLVDLNVEVIKKKLLN